jgi:hypothetical protein
MERLETAKGGSPEWQRLSNEVRELSSDLHRPTPATTPKTTPLVDYDKFTTEQIRARLVRLLDLLPEDPAPDPAPVEINSTGAPTIDAQPISTYTRDAGPPVANATPEPAPEPEPCPWCHQPLTRCAEIKETRPEDWRALHYDHPDEKKRRADEATAVMYESWRRQRKGIGGPRW